MSTTDELVLLVVFASGVGTVALACLCGGLSIFGGWRGVHRACCLAGDGKIAPEEEEEEEWGEEGTRGASRSRHGAPPLRMGGRRLAF